MDDILVINPAEIRNLESTSSVYSFLDYIWMSGSWLAPPKNPNWSGYMELAIKGNTTICQLATKQLGRHLYSSKIRSK